MSATQDFPKGKIHQNIVACNLTLLIRCSKQRLDTTNMSPVELVETVKTF